jgi:hypothetical protein
MITNYPQNPSARKEGQVYGSRKSAPLTIPKLAQIAEVVLVDASPAASEAWVLTATDDETGQIWTLPITSGASLAASLDAAVAAVVGNGKFNDLFSASEDGVDTLTLTAKHVGRGYTFALDTSAGSATSTITITQVAGGDKVPFARMLARSSVAGEARLLGSTDALRDLAGATVRHDFNHTRPFEPSAQRAGYDGLDRGKTVSLAHECRMAGLPETAPSALTDSVFVRRAQTSSAGNVGAFSAAAAGGQQSHTFTPSAVNLPGYGFEFDYAGAHYTALYLGDGSTTVAQACDGLVQDLGSITGLTITDGATEVTIQTAAGTQLENVRNLASHTDVPVDSVAVAESVAGDLDSIDITSVARWESLPDAGGLCVVRLDML